LVLVGRLESECDPNQCIREDIEPAPLETMGTTSLGFSKQTRGLGHLFYTFGEWIGPELKLGKIAFLATASDAPAPFRTKLEKAALQGLALSKDRCGKGPPAR
jgi:hypothetical protein